MKEFYKQVHVDEVNLRFYAVCHNCHNRVYGGKVPLLLRYRPLLRKLAQGKANSLFQKKYNKHFAMEVQQLSTSFNLCYKCGSWYCDDCFELGKNDNHQCVPE